METLGVDRDLADVPVSKPSFSHGCSPVVQPLQIMLVLVTIIIAVDIKRKSVFFFIKLPAEATCFTY